MYQVHCLAQGYEATEQEGRYRQMNDDVRQKARKMADRYGGTF